MIKKITLKIKGMHCSSCAMNIDGELEDTKGVLESKTSYAKGETNIEYDPNFISEDEIQKIVKKAGYETDIYRP